MNECKVCGTPDHRKPMCFRNTDHCCERHRKIIAGELTPNAMEFIKLKGTKYLREAAQ